MTERSPNSEPATAADATALGNARCARCGAPFSCGAHDPDKPCWCTRLAPLQPQPDLSGCLCPACLQAALAAGRGLAP